jgi:hypothetical protein
VYSATTVEEWTAVLNLAAMWKFESIKAFSIERLANLASPIDKIVLGRKHNVVEWLSGAYREVCERDGALTLEEAHRLGMEDVVRISSLRQDIRGGKAFGSGLLLSVNSIRKRFELEDNDPLVSSNGCNGKTEAKSCASAGSSQVSEPCAPENESGVLSPYSNELELPSTQEFISGATKCADYVDEDYGTKSSPTCARPLVLAGTFPSMSSPVGRGSAIRGGGAKGKIRLF